MSTSVFDMDLGTSWPLLLSAVIIICCFIYIWELTRSYYLQRSRFGDKGGIESFTGSSGSGVDQRIDDMCYDEFYAKVYDQLVQPIARAPMETKVILDWLENDGRAPSTIRVADLGCGTGLHVELFSRQGVHSIKGFDKSPAMIAEAKRRFTDHANDFIVGDVTVPTMAAAGQFDLITMYYFTLYLIPERTQMLKNIYLWLDLGGVFAVHIVNKHKLDPVLESASPFVGFSVQRYADERITKSEVVFDEFQYQGNFDLHGSRATYEEIFKFTDGTSRRHEHRLWIPDINVIVTEIEAIGFKLKHHVDLTAIGYEYMYIFFFSK